MDQPDSEEEEEPLVKRTHSGSKRRLAKRQNTMTMYSRALPNATAGVRNRGRDKPPVMHDHGI